MPTAVALTQADDVITRVEKRIAMVTHLPEDNGEGLQILHYEAGQARCPEICVPYEGLKIDERQGCFIF